MRIRQLAEKFPRLIPIYALVADFVSKLAAMFFSLAMTKKVLSKMVALARNAIAKKQLITVRHTPFLG
jgi:hypothetical protein